LASIDAGIFAERKTSLFGQKFYQTLEPRFYYLFSKHTNEDNQPIFDTSALTFDFQQLYRSRWVTGYDRFQEANQLSTGITTRYINPESGIEYLNASLGKIFYFAGQNVSQPDPLMPFLNSESDFFAQLNIFPNRTFSLNGDLQYDPKNKHIKRGHISLRYKSEDGKIFNLEHSHRKIEKLYSERTKIDETRISTYFPLGSKWHIMGAWSYNWDIRSSMEDLFGIEYDSCCWKARLIYSRYLDRIPGQKIITPFYSELDRNESIQIQLLLKGMGSLGPRVDKLMSTMIKGFNFGET
jgi:LPS-assembly protein